MYDIEFDIVQREIIMDGNDFATTANPSTQNGGILLNSRCAFLSAPMAGIGLEDTINSSGTKLAFEMNRWKAQALNDSATICRWSAVTGQSGVPDVIMEISYL